MYFQVFTSIFHYAVPWNHPSTVEQECASSIPVALVATSIVYGVRFCIRKPVDRVLHGLPNKAVQMVSELLFINLDGIDD